MARKIMRVARNAFYRILFQGADKLSRDVVSQWQVRDRLLRCVYLGSDATWRRYFP